MISVYRLYLGHLPYAETFDFASLPTHFSQTDHSALLSISTSGFLASYIPKSSRSDRDAASVRANCPIPTSVGLFYFEVEIVDAGQRGYIGIGLSGKRVNLSRLPGWEKGSFGWHGDDGMVFCEKGQGSPFGPSYTTGGSSPFFQALSLVNSRSESNRAWLPFPPTPTPLLWPQM